MATQVNPLLMAGIKPTVTTLSGGTVALNKDFYGSRAAADQFATLFGGKVVSVDNTFGGNLTQFNAPLQYQIQVANGRQINVGLAAESFQKYGWSQFNPIWVDIGGWSPERQAAFEKGLPSPPLSVTGQAKTNAALTLQYETSLKASVPAKTGVPHSTTVAPASKSGTQVASSPSLATSGEKASPGKINPTVDAHTTQSETRPGSGTLASGSDRVWHLLTFGEPPSTGNLAAVDAGIAPPTQAGLPAAPTNILSAFLQGIGFWFEHPTDAAQMLGHETQILVGSGSDNASRAQAFGLLFLPLAIAYLIFFRSK
jgi:hypothetical protein